MICSGTTPQCKLSLNESSITVKCLEGVKLAANKETTSVTSYLWSVRGNWLSRCNEQGQTLQRDLMRIYRKLQAER